MNVNLAYGKKGLVVGLKDEWNVHVVEPKYVPALPDAAQAIREALNAPIQSLPLKERAKNARRIGVIFNDITRPTPNDLILKVVLGELADTPKENITLFNALGTHRPNTETELRTMLGADIFDACKIVQNDCADLSTHVYFGKTLRGHEIWINRQLSECDLIILTGFIEPHFFAGFSGGGKAVMPGMAALSTIMQNHSAAMIADPNATWGITTGNPIWEEVQEIAKKMPEVFLLNVTLNREKHITGVFAGDLVEAHVAGCARVKTTAMAPVKDLFDIVISTNSGYPLDLNLYQSVKGMSAAGRIVRPGGAILMAAECWDGIPEHGLYGQILTQSKNPQEILDKIMNSSETIRDQWQAQIQAQIQLKADVYLYSDYLSADQLRSVHIFPISSMEETLERLVNKYGAASRIAVLPEGPQTVPFLG